AKSPEAIFLAGYYTEAGLIARQARELGLNQPILGGDGWESAQLLQIGGDAMNGNYYSNHFAVDNPDPRLQGFLKKYRDTFKHDPDAIGGLAPAAPVALFPSLDKLSTQTPHTVNRLAPAHAGSA